MTDDQAALREAMEWLDKVPVSIWWDNHAQEEYRATLKRRLAMLVDLADTLRAMHDEWEDYSFLNRLGGYDKHNMRRARSILTQAGVEFAPDRDKPATKTVWRVSWGDGRPYVDSPNYLGALQWLSLHLQTAATTITPVEVPA